MYEYKAKLLRVIDGDTLDAMIDLGFDVWVKKRIRLHGIDTPETRTRDEIEKNKGILAKAALQKVLKSSEDEFLIISHGVGKYGRCLGEIILAKNLIRTEKYHGKSVNEFLLKEGYANKYDS